MYLDKVRDMCASDGGQEAYLKWLEDPVTQLFIGAIRESGRPRRPDLIQPEAAFLSLGVSLGYNQAADLLENPRGLSSTPSAPLEASYGASAPVPTQ